MVEKYYAKEDYANDVQIQLGMCFSFLRKKPVVPEHSLNCDNFNAFVPI